MHGSGRIRHARIIVKAQWIGQLRAMQAGRRRPTKKLSRGRKDPCIRVSFSATFAGAR